MAGHVQMEDTLWLWTTRSPHGMGAVEYRNLPISDHRSGAVVAKIIAEKSTFVSRPYDKSFAVMFAECSQIAVIVTMTTLICASTAS